MSAGHIIRDYLGDHDIKYKQIALALSISPSTMSGYMTGKRSIPEDILIQMANYLNISTDYIHGLTKEPRRPLQFSTPEHDLIEGYRTLAPDQQALLLQTLNFMRAQNLQK